MQNKDKIIYDALNNVSFSQYLKFIEERIQKIITKLDSIGIFSQWSQVFLVASKLNYYYIQLAQFCFKNNITLHILNQFDKFQNKEKLGQVLQKDKVILIGHFYQHLQFKYKKEKNIKQIYINSFFCQLGEDNNMQFYFKGIVNGSEYKK